MIHQPPVPCHIARRVDQQKTVHWLHDPHVRVIVPGCRETKHGARVTGFAYGRFFKHQPACWVSWRDTVTRTRHGYKVTYGPLSIGRAP